MRYEDFIAVLRQVFTENSEPRIEEVYSKAEPFKVDYTRENGRVIDVDKAIGLVEATFYQLCKMSQESEGDKQWKKQM